MPDDRAVSPVVGAVVMIAIVIALAAVVATGFVSLGAERVDSVQAGPYFGTNVDGQKITDGHNCDEDVIRIEHGGGEPVPVEDLEITIETDAGHDEAVLRDLPLEQHEHGLFSGQYTVQDSEIDGNDDLIDQSYGTGSPECMEGPILDNGDDTFSGGDSIVFRVPHSTPDPDIQPGDQITVTLVDTEQRVVVLEWTTIASDG